MFAARLIIDAPDVLVFVRDTAVVVEDLPARIVRAQVDSSENLQRRSGVPARVYPVVGEPAAVQANARASGKRCPVTAQHRRRGNKCTARCRVLAQKRALITAEEKQLVLYNGTADGSAKLVPLE